MEFQNQDEFKSRPKRIGNNRFLPDGLGKLPPQALELEGAVLGALMLEKDALTAVIDILKPESFYKEAHKETFNAIKALFAESEPIDLMTVTMKLRSLGRLEAAGGPQYIAGLTDRVNSAANIESHARIISEQAIRRALLQVASEIERDGYDDTVDVFQFMDRVQQLIFDVSESYIRKNYMDMRTLAKAFLDDLEAKKDQKDGLTGIPSGFSALDRVTSGFQKSDLVIIAARPGMGKCLGRGTQVLMYDGLLKKVEDIEVGELLMGNDSTPRTVLSVARGREKMYWIHQNKGISYRVNESHILSLKRSRNEGKHKKGEVLNITVKEYLEKSARFKTNYKGYKTAIEFDEKEVSIHPYFLGLWLGDGHNYSSRITNTDNEVIQYLHEYATELNLQLVEYKQVNRISSYSITKGNRGKKVFYSIQRELRKLYVIQNKHIPQAYLTNTTQNRLLLLAGLIDSDGHYLADSNGYEITQKNEHLARQIKFLCDSLGFRTSLKKKKAQIASIGYQSEVFRVRFYGDVDKIPVRIERKKAKPWQSKIDWKVTGIQVAFDKEDEYFGFEIDRNRLFLLEDMTVTHNTAFVVSAMRNAAVDFNHGVAIFSLEMSSLQLMQRLVSAEAELDSEKLKKAQLAQHEYVQLNYAIRRLENARIFIDDTPALSILELRAKCRKLKTQYDINMVIIDYLQLMTADTGGKNKGGNREQEIATISKSLKSIAKELSVPVIALSQLSRAVETRGGDKRPQLSDLRESGCLSGDTLIQDASSGKQITIKALAERQLQEPLTCFSVTEHWQVSPAQMVKVFYSGQKQVFELKTRSGRTIKASANHPFLKLNGWTRLDALEAGDKIALPRKITVQNPKNPLSEEELILVAHLIGDGCILPKQPYHYTSADPENLKVVSQTAKKLFDINTRLIQQGNWWHLYLKSPYPLTHHIKHPITIWFEKLGLKRVRSYEKQVPEAVFESDESGIALFLKHLWATDGNISWIKSRGRTDAGAIYYASTSRMLSAQVQHLLIRLGIQSTLRDSQKKGYRKSYQVWIQGVENQFEFLRKVGCYGQRGNIIPDLIESLSKIQTNPNTDIIPREAWQELIYPLKEQTGLSWRGFAQNLNVAYNGSGIFKHGISRSRLQKIYQVLPFAVLKNLAQSDVFWDEISSITPLGIEDVYDATVEEHHNFVANDILVHNSIEQDADMVMFLYRPEYYGLTADEAGNSTAGIGEVIIAKHRNGSLDTVQLRFIGKYTKFTDLDSGDLVPIKSVMPDGLSGFEGESGTIVRTMGSKINQSNPPPPDEPPF